MFAFLRKTATIDSRAARICIRSLYLAAVVIFLISLRPFWHRHTGFTSLIDFGSRFYNRSLPVVRAVPHEVAVDSWGNDGQFYAQLAVDPLLRYRQLDVALDNPQYRSRRILFSWTAYLAGLGEPGWILHAYAVQNIVAWLVLAGVLLRWLPPSRPRNLLPWIGCLFSAGMLISVRSSMLEGPGAMLLALALLAHERRRSWLATGLIAASGLGRETNLIASGLLIDRVPRTLAEVMRVVGLLVLMALPFLLWTRYVASVFPNFSYNNPDNFALPFSGYLSAWTDAIFEFRDNGWHSNARYLFPVLIGLGVQFAFVVLRWDWKSAWWRAAAPYCLLFVMISHAVWGGLPTAAPRVLLPLTLAFNVLVAREQQWPFWVLVVLGNLGVVTGIAYSLPVPWLSTLF